jgi:hypothetical protein
VNHLELEIDDISVHQEIKEFIRIFNNIEYDELIEIKISNSGQRLIGARREKQNSTGVKIVN